MAKFDKALAKLCSIPPPVDFRWDELSAILEHLGYEAKPGKGSRYKFVHEDRKLIISCHRPHPSPNIDKGCVRDVVEHLRTNNFI